MKYEVKTTKLPKSEVELQISLPSDFLVSARKKAIEMIGLSLDIAGFRKGHIPEKIIIEKVGEKYILEESAELVLKEHFPKIIEQEKLDPIGRPDISIIKLALGNPLEFKITCAVVPVFTLPDYKAITKKENSKKEEVSEVTEKEIEDVILQIRKNKAHYDWHEAHKDEEGHNHPDLEKEENLPIVDDAFVQKAGNFKDVEEFRAKIKENIAKEKADKQKDKKRASMMEALTKATEMEIPEILVESEIDKSIAQMKDSVERMGVTWEEYLTNTNKKNKKEDASIETAEEEIRKDLRESAENKAKIQLIFNKIAEEEKLSVNQDILNNEIKDILEHYPDASEESARIYVSTVLLNQEVLKLLENN